MPASRRTLRIQPAALPAVSAHATHPVGCHAALCTAAAGGTTVWRAVKPGLAKSRHRLGRADSCPRPSGPAAGSGPYQHAQAATAPTARSSALPHCLSQQPHAEPAAIFLADLTNPPVAVVCSDTSKRARQHSSAARRSDSSNLADERVPIASVRVFQRAAGCWQPNGGKVAAGPQCVRPRHPRDFPPAVRHAISGGAPGLPGAPPQEG